MRVLLIVLCLLLVGCSANDGRYRYEPVTIKVSGRTGHLLRRGSWLEGGGFLVKYADDIGDVHCRVFQEDELEFDDD